MSSTTYSATAAKQPLAAQLLTAMQTAHGNETTFREDAAKLLEGVSSAELCDALLGDPNSPDSTHNRRSSLIHQYVSSSDPNHPTKYLLTRLDSADTLRVLTSPSYCRPSNICPFYSPMALEQALSTIQWYEYQWYEWQHRQNLDSSKNADQDYANNMRYSQDLIASLLGNLTSADALKAVTVPFIGETRAGRSAPENGNNPLTFVIRARHYDIVDAFLEKLDPNDLFTAFCAQNERGELPLVIEIQHGVSNVIQRHLLRLSDDQRNRLYHLKDSRGVSPNDVITREKKNVERRAGILGNIRLFFGEAVGDAPESGKNPTSPAAAAPSLRAE